MVRCISLKLCASDTQTGTVGCRETLLSPGNSVNGMKSWTRELRKSGEAGSVVDLKLAGRKGK